ncbi:pyruvate/2-oxoglutarate dehydrogenase complex dihydrolipoamide dehydrogenase (E3) component [Microbacterium sp. AK009]|uniref:dihydrolipoyl dehydrogenase family protein n=1 Tax=Microbacterium sp. AK009 TaxID=2723068 RepID=UPI0015CE0C81|nr:FAD-dependent oxidoreductase [Microbacterium sp. AK009]NYF16846.1 pyruvate/2-oxoglutarate dehydrogenase complex dihydrolipoamide dehydrogenase (E3) component [Microbacterium sp. AK009]
MTAPSSRRPRILSAAEAAGDWDLIVIGAGSAGLVASRTAASLGARTLLIEAARFGGECLYTGCVPSKALIAAAHTAHTARTASRLGVDVEGVTVDFARVMAHVRASIAHIEPVDAPEALVAKGVFVLTGHARLTGSTELVVDGHRLRFRDAVIAAGSHPVTPDVPGAADLPILTNETFWDLDEQPESLLVQGGGPIGCELAQAMARLGTRVTLVHRGERILPREDAAASRLVHDALVRDGVDVRVKTTVTALTPAGSSGAGTARLSDGKDVAFDRMLAAIGRRAATAGLGLDAAGVRLTPDGDVEVDRTLRTSNPRIRAAGDVTALPRFTHTAGFFASTAATNAVLGLSRTVDVAAVPRVTFTAPEVGAIGVAPVDAQAKGLRVVTKEHDDVDRAVADHDTAGHTTLVIDRRGRLQGASVVGPRAGEVLGELTTAVAAGLNVRALASTIHAYPTYADAAWNAAIGAAQEGLDRGIVGRGIRFLRRRHARRTAL